MSLAIGDPQGFVVINRFDGCIVRIPREQILTLYREMNRHGSGIEDVLVVGLYSGAKLRLVIQHVIPVPKRPRDCTRIYDSIVNESIDVVWYGEQDPDDDALYLWRRMPDH